MGYSGPMSEMWGPDVQGRNLEFTINTVAFSASGKAFCHCGTTAAPNPVSLPLQRLWIPRLCSGPSVTLGTTCHGLRIPQPCSGPSVTLGPTLLLWTSNPSAVQWAVSDVESVAFPKSACVFWPKPACQVPYGNSSHLLPPQTVPEGWPHTKPTPGPPSGCNEKRTSRGKGPRTPQREEIQLGEEVLDG